MLRLDVAACGRLKVAGVGLGQACDALVVSHLRLQPGGLAHRVLQGQAQGQGWRFSNEGGWRWRCGLLAPVQGCHP